MGSLQSFPLTTGPVAHVNELKYIAALLQTCEPHMRENGTISSVDIQRFLISRYGINILHDEQALDIIRGLGGGVTYEKVKEKILAQRLLEAKMQNLEDQPHRHFGFFGIVDKLTPRGADTTKEASNDDPEDAKPKEFTVETPVMEYWDLIQLASILIIPEVLQSCDSWKQGRHAPNESLNTSSSDMFQNVMKAFHSRLSSIQQDDEDENENPAQVIITALAGFLFVLGEDDASKEKGSADKSTDQTADDSGMSAFQSTLESIVEENGQSEVVEAGDTYTDKEETAAVSVQATATGQSESLESTAEEGIEVETVESEGSSEVNAIQSNTDTANSQREPLPEGNDPSSPDPTVESPKQEEATSAMLEESSTNDTEENGEDQKGVKEKLMGGFQNIPDKVTSLYHGIFPGDGDDDAQPEKFVPYDMRNDAPFMTPTLVYQLLKLCGEHERAQDVELILEMTAVASSSSGRFDEEALVNAISSDIRSFDTEWITHQSTYVKDIFGDADLKTFEQGTSESMKAVEEDPESHLEAQDGEQPAALKVVKGKSAIHFDATIDSFASTITLVAIWAFYIFFSTVFISLMRAAGWGEVSCDEDILGSFLCTLIETIISWFLLAIMLSSLGLVVSIIKSGEVLPRLYSVHTIHLTLFPFLFDISSPGAGSDWNGVSVSKKPGSLASP